MAGVPDAAAAAADGGTCEATVKGAAPFVAVLFAVDAAVAVFRATPAHTLLKAECVRDFAGGGGGGGGGARAAARQPLRAMRCLLSRARATAAQPSLCARAAFGAGTALCRWRRWPRSSS